MMQQDLTHIGFYTLSDQRIVQGLDNDFIKGPLWRCELILTDKCNFKCPYCRGLRSDCAGDMPLDNAQRVLDFWLEHKLKNVRFSGGEPTLYPHLERLVKMAKDGGVEHIAVSSNGSASPDTYESLTKVGVNDWSISLDACCASFANRMSGTVGYWSRIIKNIEVLSQLTYVTVGIVFTQDNVRQALKTIKFADQLGVKDIRVIPAAQYNKAIEVLDKLPKQLLERHPILKYRVENYRSGKHVRGLGPDDYAACPLVLDDMAVAGDFHFPCIIYLREGGAPIGNIHSGNVRGERLRWYADHDCQKDSICRQNCLDVCRDFNNRHRALRLKLDI